MKGFINREVIGLDLEYLIYVKKTEKNMASTGIKLIVHSKAPDSKVIELLKTVNIIPFDDDPNIYSFKDSIDPECLRISKSGELICEMRLFKESDHYEP